MSIKTDAKVSELEGRVLRLEKLVAEIQTTNAPVPVNPFPEGLLEKMKNEIQGIKMRMGKGTQGSH